MQSMDVLDVQQGDFGELQVALDMGKCQWRSRLRLADANRAVFLPAVPEGKNKLDLVLQLIREGWRGVAALALPPLTQQSDLQISFPISHAYFGCLCSIDDLFGKGLQSLWHNMPRYYYLALASMADLSNFPCDDRLLAMGNADFKAL